MLILTPSGPHVRAAWPHLLSAPSKLSMRFSLVRMGVLVERQVWNKWDP